MTHSESRKTDFRDRLRLFFSKPYVLLGLITFLAFVVRVTHLGTSYWGDEALSYGIVKHFPNVRDLIAYVGWVEIHPPLFYIVLHYWILVFGGTEIATRLLSVVFGCGIVLMTYLLANEVLHDKRVGLWASFLVALLPLDIMITQDARPYAMATFFALVAAVSYWRYRTHRNYSWLFLYGLATLLTLYLHYSSFLVLFVLSAFWLVDVLWGNLGRRSSAFLLWLTVHAAIVVGFSPWLPFLLYKIELRQFLIFGHPSIPVPSGRAISFADDLFDRLIWVTKGVSISMAELLAIWIFKAVAVWLVIKFFIQEKASHHLATPERWGAGFLVWYFVGLLAIFILSPQSYPYTPVPERHILLATIPFAILIAFIAMQSSRRLGALLLVVFGLSIFTTTINAMSDPALDDIEYQIRSVDEFINANYHPGDMVVAEDAYFRSDLNRYLRPEIDLKTFYPTNYFGTDLYASRDTLGLVENESQFRSYQPSIAEAFEKFDRLAKINHPKRIWFIYFHNQYPYTWALYRGWHFVLQSPLPLLPVTLVDLPPQKK